MANLTPLTTKTSSLSDSPTFAPILKSFPKGTEMVSLTREAFDRKEFNDTINTNFSQLGLSNAPETDLRFFDPNLATVLDFFNIYDNLFYSIPKEGDINSHVYLIERSTAYTNFISQQEEIDALAQEITDLRAQNLELVADMANIVDGFEQTVANLTEQING
tara:strand:- start:2454 stop:2939 length:486 start_codon:yes stop_codon:yes gene_type:complete